LSRFIGETPTRTPREPGLAWPGATPTTVSGQELGLSTVMKNPCRRPDWIGTVACAFWSAWVSTSRPGCHGCHQPESSPSSIGVAVFMAMT